MARTRRGSAALRTAAFSALQPGPRLSGQRAVRPGHALLPGSTECRAAVLAGAAGAGFSPPHVKLAGVRSYLLFAGLILCLALAMSSSAEDRFVSGPHKGFQRSATEHIITEIAKPIEVRSV